MKKKYDTTVLGLVVLDILGRPVSKIPDGGNLAYIDELRLTVAGTAGEVHAQSLPQSIHQLYFLLVHLF